MGGGRQGGGGAGRLHAPDTRCSPCHRLPARLPFFYGWVIVALWVVDAIMPSYAIIINLAGVPYNITW